MIVPERPERQLCAGPMCDRPARRNLLGYKWCEPCAKSVEQATYLASLPSAIVERVKYRRSFTDAVPFGVTPFEPLSAPAKVFGRPSGWASRR